MLALTRKANESLVLTVNSTDRDGKPITIPITIELFTIRGSQARIGIDAPDNVNVARSELLYLK